MNTLKLNQALDEAIIMATLGCANQKDLGGQKYILHPLRVMHNCNSLKDKIIALLHDSIEDGHYTLDDFREKGFSDELVEALDAITRRPEEKYSTYINRLSQNEIAVRVKIEDIKDNMDLSRLKKITERSLKRNEKYKPTLMFLEAIEALTSRPEEKYSEYINRISQNELAAIVKIKDIENSMELSKLKKSTKHRKETNKKNAATVNFLEDIFKENINDSEYGDGLCP